MSACPHHDGREATHWSRHSSVGVCAECAARLNARLDRLVARRRLEPVRLFAPSSAVTQ